MTCVDLDVKYCVKYHPLVNKKSFNLLTNKSGDDQVGEVDQETIDVAIKIMEMHILDSELCMSACNWLNYILTNSKRYLQKSNQQQTANR